MSRDDRPDISQLTATTLRILTEPIGVELLPTPDRSDAGAVGTPSPPMPLLWDLAARVAPTDSTVLITGESGVGKERLTRWLRGASPRAQDPFVAVNCGALADALLERELFGHVRGVFTGALHDRLGVFEAAQAGTLFLDEIGDVSPAMQVKFLRAIQEHEVMRLGETKARPVDVRLIATTNRDLVVEVAQQRFCEDLYYRLRVIDLHVPPLRERPEELRALSRDLLTRTAARLQRPIVGDTLRALDRVLADLWPGNIRELQHAIERACAVASGPQIDVADLPDPARGRHAVDRESARRTLKDGEVAYIRAVVERHHGHRRRAAKELGISIFTVNRRFRGLAARCDGAYNAAAPPDDWGSAAFATAANRAPESVWRPRSDRVTEASMPQGGDELSKWVSRDPELLRHHDVARSA
jgi:transcriptional regulator with PAS, ATPase and Fis domain